MFYKMFLTITIALFLVGCGGVGIITSEYNAVSKKMEKMANELTENGGVAVVGEAQDGRRDIAKKAAAQSGRNNIAIAIETKIDTKIKQFIESVGSGEIDSEINSFFSETGTSLAMRIAKGVRVPVTEVTQNEKGSFNAFALVIIDAKVINNALKDEIKVNKPKTYERIRASQAFDELKAEEEKFDAKAKELNIE